jgi:hypothetical protein
VCINLLIKVYLFLIFIKYLINESRVKIKLWKKYFSNEIMKLLQLKDSYCIIILFLNVYGQCSIKTEH